MLTKKILVWLINQRGNITEQTMETIIESFSQFQQMVMDAQISHTEYVFT
jgi:hypothetical protein